MTLDSALAKLIDDSAVIAVVGLLSCHEVDRMRIAQARVLRWIKGAEPAVLVHYIAEGSWVADQAGRTPGETALVFLETVSASDLEDRGPLRNRPHIRTVSDHMAGKRIWQLAHDGHGWMPCRHIQGRHHVVVWRTEVGLTRQLKYIAAPAPWSELGDAVPLVDLIERVQARVKR